MPDVEAPEIELDDDAPQFRRLVAMIVVAITLFGAVIAYLHEQNGNFEDNASREAQIASIRGFGRQVSALTEFGFDYNVFVEHELLQRRVVVASSRQRGSFSSSDAQRYGNDSERFKALRDAVGADTRVQDFSSATDLDSKLQESPDRERLQQQVFANKANDYGNKADSYVALLTVLAVSLFLLGLSLTLAGRGRYFLAVPGLGIAVLCVVWAVIITTGSITRVSPNAVDLTADGQQLATASNPVDDPAGFRNNIQSAIDKYRAAIDDSPEFSAAWSRLADAEFLSGLSTSSGGQFQSISDPEATKRAVEAGEKAISLGETDATLLSSVGFFHFAIGEYDRAEELSELALEGNDQFPPLVFNLGVVQVAKGKADAARATYERGIELLADKRFDVLRPDIISAARTDLDIAVTSTPDSADLAQEMKGLLAVAEVPDLPDKPDGASVDNVTISTDRFRLFATYDADGFDSDSQLLNVWYFRPLDRNGSGPFQQVASMNSVSFTGQNPVFTNAVENGSCLPGGDYRVEVYAGRDLVGTSELNFGDSPLGALQVEGGEEVGFTLCRPDTWEPLDVGEAASSLAFVNPDDPTQSVLVFSFPVGSGAGVDNAAILQATVQSAIDQQQIRAAGAPTAGEELLGRSVDGLDVTIATTSVQGTDPQGHEVRITASIGADDVVRVVILTAASTTDMDVVRSELVNSVRFLRVPDASSASGG